MQVMLLPKIPLPKKLSEKIARFSTQKIDPATYWDYYGSFDEQRLFSVKFARFRNFFDFAQIWGILESNKLWEIQCWRVADGDYFWLEHKA